MSIDRWKIQRFHEPNLEQVDLWDTCVDDEGTVSRTVFERLGKVRLESLRRDGVEDDEIARTLAAELVNVLELLHKGEAKVGADAAPPSFNRVFVEGRILELAGFRAAIGKLAPSFEIALAPPRAACTEQGAERLIARIQNEHAARPLVVDIGHSAIRTVALEPTRHRTSLERSFERLPLARGSVPPPSPANGAAYVARSVDFIARAVVTSLTAATTVDPVLILAFPCDLDDAGTPGPCTYPGWEGNETIASRIVGSIEEQLKERCSEPNTWNDSQSIDVWLLTHAELVALASEAVLGPAGPGGTMAVSLGFGPGAAILRGSE